MVVMKNKFRLVVEKQKKMWRDRIVTLEEFLIFGLICGLTKLLILLKKKNTGRLEAAF